MTANQLPPEVQRLSGFSGTHLVCPAGNGSLVGGFFPARGAHRSGLCSNNSSTPRLPGQRVHMPSFFGPPRPTSRGGRMTRTTPWSGMRQLLADSGRMDIRLGLAAMFLRQKKTRRGRCFAGRREAPVPGLWAHDRHLAVEDGTERAGHGGRRGTSPRDRATIVGPLEWRAVAKMLANSGSSEAASIITKAFHDRLTAEKEHLVPSIAMNDWDLADDSPEAIAAAKQVLAQPPPLERADESALRTSAVQLLEKRGERQIYLAELASGKEGAPARCARIFSWREARSFPRSRDPAGLETCARRPARQSPCRPTAPLHRSSRRPGTARGLRPLSQGRCGSPALFRLDNSIFSNFEQRMGHSRIWRASSTRHLFELATRVIWKTFCPHPGDFSCKGSSAPMRRTLR